MYKIFVISPYSLLILVFSTFLLLFRGIVVLKWQRVDKTTTPVSDLNEFFKILVHVRQTEPARTWTWYCATTTTTTFIASRLHGDLAELRQRQSSTHFAVPVSGDDSNDDGFLFYCNQPPSPSPYWAILLKLPTGPTSMPTSI